jgi:hypothetical protein
MGGAATSLNSALRIARDEEPWKESAEATIFASVAS